MEDTAKYQQYAEKVRIFKGLSAEEVGDILRQGHSLDYGKARLPGSSRSSWGW